MAALIVFWAALGALAWTWAGYPATILALGRRHRMPERGTDRPGPLPRITIIVPVHDEEQVLAGKLRNCLELDYPADRFDVIVAMDGCRDASTGIARAFAARHPGIRLLESETRLGKSTMQNRAARMATGEILLLTDVDAVLSVNALRLVARHLSNEGAGCVSGRVVWRAESNAGRADSENLYWRFEHALWRCEDALGVLAWASGPCMALRRDAYRQIEPWYGDDVVLPLEVCAQRRAVHYEPALVALESSPEDAAAALRARSRMTLRSLTATLSRHAVYRPWRRPGLFAAVLSHKLLRWATPFLFLCVLGTAIPLALAGQAAAQVMLGLQAAGLAAAGAGQLTRRSGGRGIPLTGAAYEFTLENAGVLIGVLRAVLRRRQVAFSNEGPGAGDPEELRPTAISSGPPPHST